MLLNKYEQLRKDLGMISTEPCTNEENKQFAEMVKNGHSLPTGILQGDNKDSNGNPCFYYYTVLVSPRDEQTYLLMKIAKTTQSLLTFFIVLFILSIVLGLVCIGIIISNS